MNQSLFRRTIAVAIFGFSASLVSAADAPRPSVPFTLSKETTAITEPLKADGTVDYVAAISAKYGADVTLDNNGYVLWLKATGATSLPTSVRAHTLAALGIAEADLPKVGLDEKVPDDLPERQWKAGDNASVAAYLSANQTFLDLAVQASQRPVWWDAAISLDGTFGQVLLPSLNHVRQVSRALCCRALLRAGQGDFDGFRSDVLTVKRLSRLSSGWTLVHLLVAAANSGLANDTIAAVVANGSATSAQCAQLAKELDLIEPAKLADDVLDTGERWSVLEYIQRIAIGKAKLTGLGGANIDHRFAGLDRGEVDWDVTLRRVNEHVDHVVAIMRDPAIMDVRSLEQALDKSIAEINAKRGSSQTMAKKPGETREAYSNRLADTLIPITLPSFSRASVTLRRGRMMDEITRAVVAAAQYRADNSRWSATLSDLVPKYLPAVPRDIYSPSAADSVRYLQSEAGIFIYSIGANQTDDGGIRDEKAKQDDIGLGIAPNPAEQGL